MSGDTPTSTRQKVTYALCWTARIWGLLIMLITLLTVLAHVVASDTEPGSYPPAENLIPVATVISVLGLAIAWKWPLHGAIINLTFFVVNLLIYWILNKQFLALPVVLVLSPIYIPGILFLVCWWLSPRDKGSQAA